jgi:hypothetical protein
MVPAYTWVLTRDGWEQVPDFYASEDRRGEWENGEGEVWAYLDEMMDGEEEDEAWDDERLPWGFSLVRSPSRFSDVT